MRGIALIGVALVAVAIVAGLIYGGGDATGPGPGAPGDPASSSDASTAEKAWFQREGMEGWTAIADGQPVPTTPAIRNTTGPYGGTVTLSINGDLGSIHPLDPDGATAQQLRGLIWDNLTGYENNQWTEVPKLATHWESSPDHLTWTFHLREGVIWSDGEPFDADDVVFTFTALFEPSFTSSTQDSLRDSQGRYPKVEKVDRYTVRFTLHEIDAIFLDHVSYVYIMPQHLWQQAHDERRFKQILRDKQPETLARMVGTGAFKLVDYKTAEAMVFARSNTHWRFDREGKRLPYADRVVYRVVPNLDTEYQKFIAGDFDVLDALRPEDYVDARAKSAERDFTVYPLGPSLGSNYLCFNQNPGKNPESGEPYVAPWKLEFFRKSEFRRAVSHAMDRQKMVDILLEGRGEPGYHYCDKANKSWYTPHAPTFEFDKAKARALLDGLGLKDTDGDGLRETPSGQRFSFEILTNSENTTRIKMGNMIKTDLRDVGLDATLRPIAFNTLIPLLRSQFAYDSVILGWASAVPPDPLGGKNIVPSTGELHMWYPQQKTPSTEWEAEIDRVFGEMGRSPELARRKELFDRVQVLMGEHQPLIYTVNSNVYSAVRNRFRNLKPCILRPYTYWNLFEVAVEK